MKLAPTSATLRKRTQSSVGAVLLLIENFELSPMDRIVKKKLNINFPSYNSNMK